MARTWVTAPYHYDRPEAFEQCWNYDWSNGVIAIGWNMGNVATLGREELEAKYLSLYGDAPGSRHQVVKFWHDIQPGDRIIARGGRKKIVGIGTVTGAPFHNPTMGKDRTGELDIRPYENFLPVRWESGAREFPNQVFGMQTVTEMELERYSELLTRKPDGPVLEDTLTSRRSIANETDGFGERFSLERHLEDFIVANFDRVFSGQLALLTEDTNKGRQYPTDIGIIDILSWDPNASSYVVIELKRGKTSDVVVGQTLRYMGWIKEHLCQENTGVRGLIICEDADERLDYALSMTPQINVRYYRVNFQLLTNSPE